MYQPVQRLSKSIRRLYKNDWRGVFGRGRPAKEPLHRQLSPCFSCVRVFCLLNSPWKGQGIFLNISCIISFVPLLKLCQQLKHSLKCSIHYLPLAFHHKTTLKRTLARTQNQSLRFECAVYSWEHQSGFWGTLWFLQADWIFSQCGSNLSLPLHCHQALRLHSLKCWRCAGPAVAQCWHHHDFAPPEACHSFQWVLVWF